MFNDLLAAWNELTPELRGGLIAALLPLLALLGNGARKRLLAAWRGDGLNVSPVAWRLRDLLALDGWRITGGPSSQSDSLERGNVHISRQGKAWWSIPGHGWSEIQLNRKERACLREWQVRTRKAVAQQEYAKLLAALAPPEAVGMLPNGYAVPDEHEVVMDREPAEPCSEPKPHGYPPAEWLGQRPSI